MNKPVNCLKCEYHVEDTWRDRIDLRVVDWMYSCSQQQGTRSVNRTLVAWQDSQRRRITPPAWCPLRQEGGG